MNDPEFLEAARALAGRMMRDGGATEAARIAYGFQLATARPPKPRESEILLSSYRYYLEAFRNDAAKAYATVASLILNLDATVTKE